MSATMKLGHAELEIRRLDDDALVLIAAGYGRERFVAAQFLGERQAATARALVARGALDVAPVIWETGEHATDEQRSALFTAPIVGTRVVVNGEALVIRQVKLGDGTVWSDPGSNPPIPSLADGFELVADPDTAPRSRK